MLWDIHSEMLTGKLDILDGNSEAVRDFSEEMASGSRGNGELAGDRGEGREGWDRKLDPGDACI